MALPSSSAAIVFGTDSLDILIGFEIDEIFRGFDGNDTLVGNGGRDFLFGGAGDDTLLGGTGSDFLEGGAGADRLDGGAGIDSVNYHGSAAAVTVDLGTRRTSGGDAEGDVLVDIENVRGSHNDDVLIGDDGDNFLCGLGGDDLMLGGAGDDILRGAENADRLDGGAGTDTSTYWSSDAGVTVDLAAGTGRGGHAEGDTLVSIEIVQGSRYADDLGAATGGSTLYGYGGDDTLTGREGADVLTAGIGDDTLAGGDGADQLFGDDGDDLLDGGAGDDLLTAGAGDDAVAGGAGADSFKFRRGDGRDTITDFEAGTDLIVFSDGKTTWRDIETVQVGADTRIDYGPGDSILVQDATTAEVWGAFDFY